MTWQKQSENQPQKGAQKGVQKVGSKPVGMGRAEKAGGHLDKVVYYPERDRAAEKDHRGACLARLATSQVQCH